MGKKKKCCDKIKKKGHSCKSCPIADLVKPDPKKSKSKKNKKSKKDKKKGKKNKK